MPIVSRNLLLPSSESFYSFPRNFFASSFLQLRSFSFFFGLLPHLLFRGPVCFLARSLRSFYRTRELFRGPLKRSLLSTSHIAPNPPLSSSRCPTQPPTKPLPFYISTLLASLWSAGIPLRTFRYSYLRASTSKIPAFLPPSSFPSLLACHPVYTQPPFLFPFFRFFSTHRLMYYPHSVRVWVYPLFIRPPVPHTRFHGL